jgi:hypothetical protein
MIASILSGSLFFDGLSHHFDAPHFYALIDAPVLESLRGYVMRASVAICRTIHEIKDPSQSENKSSV